MAVSTPTIVPANRLGQLLSEARLSAGGDLEAYASRSEFTVGELSDFEAGHRLLNEKLVREVSALYELDCGQVIPERSRLVIDLTGNSVSIAGEAVQLESAERDHILDRYLSLVYVLRNIEPGTEIPLRYSDVGILSDSLAEREELIIDQLQRSMEQDADEVRGLTAWFRRRLWVPRAGMLVGMVSVGSLVMVSGDAAASVPTSELLPDHEPASPAGGRLLVPQGAELTSQVPSAETVSNQTAETGFVGAVEQTQVEVDEIPVAPLPAEVSLPSEDADVSEVLAAETPEAEVEGPEVVLTTAEAEVEGPEVAVATAEAEVETPEVAPGPTLSPEAQLGMEAEALLPFDISTVLPGWDVQYLGARDGYRGMTFSQTQIIELYVRPSDSASSLAGILAHELGHAIDLAHLDDQARLEWYEGRGFVPGTPWWPGSAALDFHTGAGDFAEAFAFWALGDPSSSEIGGSLDQADMALLESLLPSVLHRI